MRHDLGIGVILVSLLVGCSTAPTKQFKRQPAADGFDPDIVPIANKISELFKGIMVSRHGQSGPGVKRAVFLKPHACARATFTLAENLPSEYQVGLFAKKLWKDKKTRNAWVRVSSDTVPQTPDAGKNTLGFAVKVLDVPGPKVLPGETEFTTQDFLTQNIDRFFVDTAQDFLDITQAFLAGDDATRTYLAKHPDSDAILKAMQKPVTNALTQSFWSTTPYRFGLTGQFAKYKIIPCAQNSEQTKADTPDEKDPNYLQKQFRTDLTRANFCFKLQVQLKKGEMPLDRASQVWNEDTSRGSAPLTVATINIPSGNVAALDGQCENMEFTAWHALADHRPVGSVNEARGIIYKQLSDYRRTRNGLPLCEPSKDSYKCESN